MIYGLIVLAAAVAPAAPSFGAAPTGKDLAVQCAKCHGIDEGEMSEVTVEDLKKIVAGTTPHKPKLALSDQQIQDLVAYFKTIK
jgi:mono/diheme cytochrome c family protein